jgi:hypothetical protein
MNLDQIVTELVGWKAYFKGGPSPEVHVRVGNARGVLSCMEIGSGPGAFGAEDLKITIGEWHHPGEEDAGEESEPAERGGERPVEDRGDW